ncbi:MAG: FG-GAP repeat domain-containing protein, partial [Planctomycetota bacterium]
MKNLIYVFTCLFVVVPCIANPIPWPPPASMPLEEMYVEIQPHADRLHAVFTGDFTFTNIPNDVNSMMFPVPPGANNISAWQDGVELGWTWSSEEYPTILPEMPTIPMIEWQGPFPTNGAVFRVDYEHDLIERPEEFIFFYAVGTGKYFSTYAKITTAYFNILLPLGYTVKGVWLDDVPHAYLVEGYDLTIIVQSEYGPITNDLIISLVKSPAGDDCNGNGIPDGEELAPPLDFPNRFDRTVGNRPSAVICPDLNSDAIPDLVVTNGGSDSLSVKMNSGSGTFFGPIRSYDVGHFPVDVAAGDLDGDGDIDLAVANQNSNNVSVLLNTGNGQFALRTDYAAGRGVCSIKVVDLDGDGDLDLTVANKWDQNASVLLNNGNGSFASPTNYTVGKYPHSLTCGDFNNDGKPDLAVGATYSLAIFLNNGNGTFTPATYHLTGQYPTFVTCCDLDADGNIDIAVVDPVSRNVLTLCNNGMGVSNQGPGYGINNDPTSIIATDFDDDGSVDLAVAGSDLTSGVVSILRNRGDGTFKPGPNVETLGDWDKKIAAADLNGDSLPDLVVANGYNTNQVSVLLNQTPQPGSRDWNSNGVPDECENLKVADFDFDGDYDINDLCVFAAHWMDTECKGPWWCDGTDVDEDHVVNFSDFATFADKLPGDINEPIMTFHVDDCNMEAGLNWTAAEESNEPRFKVWVEGRYIYFEDQIYANCCPDELGLDKEIDGNQITLYEIGYGGMCDCMCYFPITATFGPFEDGTYTVEVYDNYGTSLGVVEVTIGGSTGPGITYQIEDCNQAAAISFTAEPPDNTRFTVTVEGLYIHFEDMMVANCCPDKLGLEMMVEDSTITIYETEYTPGGCYCICDYPVTATLGPFEPGIYTLEVYEYHDGF